MFKNESGFSLVELAVAAGLSVALGAVAVGVLSSASTNVKTDANKGAADASAAINDAYASGTAIGD